MSFWNFLNFSQFLWLNKVTFAVLVFISMLNHLTCWNYIEKFWIYFNDRFYSNSLNCVIIHVSPIPGRMRPPAFFSGDGFSRKFATFTIYFVVFHGVLRPILRFSFPGAWGVDSEISPRVKHRHHNVNFLARMQKMTSSWRISKYRKFFQVCPDYCIETA